MQLRLGGVPDLVFHAEGQRLCPDDVNRHLAPEHFTKYYGGDEWANCECLSLGLIWGRLTDFTAPL